MNSNTPANGIAAPPALQQALAHMGAQLESFAGEVRELKALVRQLGGAAQACASDSTLDIDVEGFKRVRRQRAALLCSAALVPLLLIVAWALWPTAARESTSRSASPPAIPKSKVPAPPMAPPATKTAPPPAAEAMAPAPLHHLSATARPDLNHIKPPAELPPPARRQRKGRIPISSRFDPAPSEPPRRPAPPISAHETSGGAPILD